MINVKDRVPAVGKTNRKKITYEDGTVVYATVENADDGTAGTSLNRALLMAMQGFIAAVTEFDTPTTGDITETNSDGDTLVTEFDTPSTGDVTETFTSGTQVITRVTKFDTPTTGDITVTIS